MSIKPLVSVFTIFLNESEFIKEAIESVCAQTYDNWELLVVDDGSTDKSTAITQKFTQEYSEKVGYSTSGEWRNPLPILCDVKWAR